MGRRPHRCRARPGWTRHDHGDLRRRPSSRRTAAPTRRRRSSSCCTAAAPTSAEILGLAAHLPTGPAYAAVRAPIAEGGGYAWFANRGIGRPRRRVAAEHHGLVPRLARRGRPGRPAGAAGRVQRRRRLRRRPACSTIRPGTPAPPILYGTLPFDAGLATDPGRLANLPVFVAQGDGDHVIPRELLDRTWDYLLSESGAPTVAQRQPGGHQLTAETVHHLGDWIAHRLAFVDHHGATPAGPRATSDLADAPRRRAARPRRPAARGELDDPAAAGVPERARRTCRNASTTQVRSLSGVDVGPSRISVPGARGFTLREGSDDEQAYLVPQVGEFAHLHPAYDGSLHLVLPAGRWPADVSTKGWGRPHMWAGTRLSPGFMMVYGPRDETSSPPCSAS